MNTLNIYVLYTHIIRNILYNIFFSDVSRFFKFNCFIIYCGNIFICIIIQIRTVLESS